jgi:NAD(P)-dependent dehydrogenase (short-subunit alcohol dehydrogenase family)
MRNRVALVTGGSRGIGDVAEKLLVSRGPCVVVGVRMVSELEQVVLDIIKEAFME